MPVQQRPGGHPGAALVSADRSSSHGLRRPRSQKDEGGTARARSTCTRDAGGYPAFSAPRNDAKGCGRLVSSRRHPRYIDGSSADLLSAEGTGVKHCKGDRGPHTPAVARGRRATSPVRAEALFHLAFSGIAASPPSASPEEPQALQCSTCITCTALPSCQVTRLSSLASRRDFLAHHQSRPR